MAGLASHESAAPAIYYLTDYYRKHPVVLARVAHLDRDALRDLLTVSRRLTLGKARIRPGRRGPSRGAAST